MYKLGTFRSKLRKYKSAGDDQMPADLIQAGGEKIVL
jgi:hypothetical protein